MSAVVCSALVKDFPSGSGTARILRGIDLEVRSGELMCIVGPSGCGKTTLISIVAGILSATQGEVSLFGEVLTRMGRRARVAFRRANIGFVFQQYNLLPALTAAENAAVPLVAAGMPLATAAKRATTILERLGMGPHAGKLPRQLSGGQQQRVAVARALVHEPRLVICDEPTAALDAESGRKAMELLRANAVRPDAAVIVVTHDNRIHHFADRITEMEDGLVLRVRSAAEGSDAH
ncbi:MAG: ABC transporter ATP-binding protein [Geminicoccaceae bacterium]